MLFEENHARKDLSFAVKAEYLSANQRAQKVRTYGGGEVVYALSAGYMAIARTVSVAARARIAEIRLPGTPTRAWE